RSMSRSGVIWLVGVEPNRMMRSGFATLRTRRTISWVNCSSMPIDYIIWRIGLSFEWFSMPLPHRARAVQVVAGVISRRSRHRRWCEEAPLRGGILRDGCQLGIVVEQRGRRFDRLVDQQVNQLEAIGDGLAQVVI